MVDYRNIDRLWHESATLLKEEPKDGDPRQLLREGKLWEVLAYVDTLGLDQRGKLSITLPDRRDAPRRFDEEGIEAMLGYPTRPGFAFKR